MDAKPKRVAPTRPRAAGSVLGDNTVQTLRVTEVSERSLGGRFLFFLCFLRGRVCRLFGCVFFEGGGG